MIEAIAALVARGRRLRNALSDPAATTAPESVAAWHRDCAALVSELSGGMKAHWLSRAFSEALLVRPDPAQPERDAPVADIIDRTVGVLEQGAAAIAQAGGLVSVPEGETPVRRRFEFVHDAALRPVLERAFIESGQAFDAGDFTRSLKTSCGVIEAIITDALQFIDSRLEAEGWRLDGGPIAEWSFDQRIAAAERAGLIRGGCARLTPIARAYRETETSTVPITARDAKIARQVLHVVLRDLDPGR